MVLLSPANRGCGDGRGDDSIGVIAAAVVVASTLDGGWVGQAVDGVLVAGVATQGKSGPHDREATAQ